MRLASGAEHELDVLICATGFDAGTGSLTRIDIRGRGRAALAEHWADGARTHLGLMTTASRTCSSSTRPAEPERVLLPAAARDYQVGCIARIIDELARARRATTVEPDPRPSQAWVGHVNDIVDMTLLPKANSWWMGANIPGKPRQFMYFLGGFAAYRDQCENALAGGLEGYLRDGKWLPRTRGPSRPAVPGRSSEESLADLHVAAI